jgi:hypothetical protein
MSMKLEKKLQTLLDYFYSTRGIGHSKALQGLPEGTHVLCETKAQAERFPNGCTYEDVHYWAGHSVPLALDNHTVMELALEARDKIASLELYVQRRDALLERMATVIEDYKHLLVHLEGKPVPNYNRRTDRFAPTSEVTKQENLPRTIAKGQF